MFNFFYRSESFYDLKRQREDIRRPQEERGGMNLEGSHTQKSTVCLQAGARRRAGFKARGACVWDPVHALSRGGMSLRNTTTWCASTGPILVLGPDLRDLPDLMA